MDFKEKTIEMREIFFFRQRTVPTSFWDDYYQEWLKTERKDLLSFENSSKPACAQDC